MKAKEKLQILSNMRNQGIDITKIMVAPLVAKVEQYAENKKLIPSDNPPKNAVSSFIVNDDNKPVALLNDGRTVKISIETYYSERLYNFLPIRYKTMIL